MNKKTSAVVLLVIVALTTVFAARYPRLLSWKLFTEKHRRLPASPAYISQISSWMTFDYINQVFSLPPEYLKIGLQIHDPRYPLLTIEQYSKKSGLDEALLIQNIKDALRKEVHMPETK